MTYGSFAHYHLSARNYDLYINGANNLVLDFAIKYAQTMNCKQFHFGGGTSLDEKNPLFQFKTNFSKTVRPFFIGKKIHDNNIYNKIVSQWSDKNPDKALIYSNYLLNYRL
jgi:lipid II:glycine glycyltransferase (peptidoglycan interpeptide bridge formation enzyme)